MSFSLPQYIVTYGYKDKLSPPLILTWPSITLNFPLGSFQPSQKESLQNQDMELPLWCIVNSLKPVTW